MFTEQAPFELAKRNVCLKCLFDGEPNLFSPLKSLFERSEIWADVDAGAHPERPAAFLRLCVCGGGFSPNESPPMTNVWSHYCSDRLHMFRVDSITVK